MLCLEWFGFWVDILKANIARALNRPLQSLFKWAGDIVVVVRAAIRTHRFHSSSGQRILTAWAR
jgi:hypothetical protein